MTEEKHCPTCGAAVAGHFNRVYCSERCRPEYVPRRRTGVCGNPDCGRPLQRREGEAANVYRRRRYCGKECYWLSLHGRRRGERP